MTLKSTCNSVKEGRKSVQKYNRLDIKLIKHSLIKTKNKKNNRVHQHYLYLPCMVDDNQPQENDCRKAYQAF